MSKKISDLPSTSSLSKTLVVPLVQSNTTYKATLESINEHIKYDAGLNHGKGISGQMIISGGLRVSGDLTSSGNSNFGFNSSHNLISKGSFFHSGVAVFSGNTSFSGEINSTGNVKLGRNLSSSINLSGAVKVGGDINNYGGLYVWGSGFVNKDLFVNESGRFGAASSHQTHLFYGKTTVSGDTYLNDRLVVANAISGNGSLYVVGDEFLNGNFYLTGDSRIGNSSTNILDIYSQTNLNAKIVSNAESFFLDKLNVLNDVRF
jgi:hypothetical protein